MFKGTARTRALYRIIYALLVVAMMITLVPIGAFAVESADDVQDNADYEGTYYETESEYYADEEDYYAQYEAYVAYRLRISLELEALERQAYLFGTGGLIRPHDDITRAEVASILFQQIPDGERASHWLQENPFPDVEINDSFNNAISMTTNIELFNGLPDGSFEPDRPITRAEVTAVIVRLAYDGELPEFKPAVAAVVEEEIDAEDAYEGLYDEYADETIYEDSANGNEDAYNADEVAYEEDTDSAQYAEITEDYAYEEEYADTDDDVACEESVNEHEGAETADVENYEDNAYDDEDIETTDGSNDYASESDDYFTDISEHWAVAYINIAAAEGWVQGHYGLGYAFYPNDTLTRAEAAAIINRAFVRLSETSDDLLPDMQVWEDNVDEDMWFYFYIQSATNSYSFSWREYEDSVYEYWESLIPARNWQVLEQPDSVPDDIFLEHTIDLEYTADLEYTDGYEDEDSLPSE